MSCGTVLYWSSPRVKGRLAFLCGTNRCKAHLLCKRDPLSALRSGANWPSFQSHKYTSKGPPDGCCSHSWPSCPGHPIPVQDRSQPGHRPCHLHSWLLCPALSVCPYPQYFVRKKIWRQDWVHGCRLGLISLSAPVALRPPPELIRPTCECTQESISQSRRKGRWILTIFPHNKSKARHFQAVSAKTKKCSLLKIIDSP